MTCNNLRLDMLLAQQRRKEERAEHNYGLGFVAGEYLLDYFEKYYSEIYSRKDVTW